MYRATFFKELNDEHGTECIYHIQHCIKPKATTAYKNLQRMFNRGQIKGFGYILNDDRGTL